MTRSEAPDVTAGSTPKRSGRIMSLRRRVRSWPGGRIVWRVGVTIVGAAVIAVGIVLLPLPGPGWLIIFAGLGILATEYTWAARLLRRVRALVRRWRTWAAMQPPWVRIGLVLLSLIVLAGIVVAAWYAQRSWF